MNETKTTRAPGLPAPVLGTLLGGLGALALTAAHAWAVRRPATTGALLVLSHAFEALAALAVLVLSAALGVRVLARAGLGAERPLELVPYAVAVGAALAGTALMAAGVVGGLRPWGVAGVVLALVAAAWPAFPALFRACAALPGDLERAVPDKGLRALLAGTILLAGAVLLLPAVAPPTDWDSLMYHLDLPAEFLRAGRMYLPEDNHHHVGFLGPIQFLYLPLLAAGALAAPAVLGVLLFGVVCLGVVACCARFLPDVTALAPLAVLGNTTLLFVAVTPRVDVTLVLYTLLAHLALLSAGSGEAGYRRFLLGGALLGMGVGVKLQAAPYVLALLPLVFWLAWKRPWDGGGRSFRPLAAFTAIGLLAGLPWLLKNQLLLGAPFYPLFSPVVLPPWLAEIFGSTLLPETVDRELTRWLGRVREPFNLVDLVLAPGRLGPEAESASYFYSPLLLLLPLALFTLKERGVRWLLVGGLGYLVLLLGFSPLTNLRYLAPGAVVLTPVALHGLAVVLAKTVRRPVVETRVLVAVVVLSLVPSLIALEGRIVDGPVRAHAAGLLPGADYALRKSDFAVLDFLVERTPPDARVLFVMEGRGFGIEREILQDPLGRNWPLLWVSGAGERCLAGTGITHVLVARASIDYWIRRGLDVEGQHIARLPGFAERCLDGPSRLGGFELWGVREAGSR